MCDFFSLKFLCFLASPLYAMSTEQDDLMIGRKMFVGGLSWETTEGKPRIVPVSETVVCGCCARPRSPINVKHVFLCKTITSLSSFPTPPLAWMPR
jgi:hypothetical protein